MTTGFQFGHIDWYSAAGAKKRGTFSSSYGSQRGRGWSANEVLAEAARLHGNCGHVRDPQPPCVLVGDFDQVRMAISAWSESMRTEVRRKDGSVAYRAIRSDAPVMAAGVISFPRDREGEWNAFRDHAISQLREKYGDRLRCVVEHLDESHPHLHFYAVPQPGEKFGAVHEGYAASRRARAEPENSVRTAYKEAMAMWQDWLYQAIAKPFGLARLGPKRSRTTRKEWLEDERRRLDERDQKIKKMLADIQRRDQLLAYREIDAKCDLAEKIENVQAMVAETEKSRQQLATMFTALDKVKRDALLREHPEIQYVLSKPKKLRF